MHNRVYQKEILGNANPGGSGTYDSPGLVNRRGGDSNPRYGVTRTLVFETSSFSRSDTSPAAKPPENTRPHPATHLRLSLDGWYGRQRVIHLTPRRMSEHGVYPPDPILGKTRPSRPLAMGSLPEMADARKA